MYMYLKNGVEAFAPELCGSIYIRTCDFISQVYVHVLFMCMYFFIQGNLEEQKRQCEVSSQSFTRKHRMHAMCLL